MKTCLLFIVILLLNSPVFSQTSTAKTDKILLQYFQNQEYAKAVIYLRLNRPADSANLHYLSLLGYACYMSNRLTDATRCYKEILQRKPQNPRALYYLGRINISKGNLPAAQRFYCRLVTYRPGVAAYYKQLAVLFSRLKNNAAAGWYFEKAYHLNPDDAFVVSHFCSYLLIQGLTEKADSILGRALQKDSLQADLLALRIRSAYLQKEYKTIFPLAGKLKEMRSIHLKPFLFAAIGHYQLEQYDSCIATCQLLTQNKLSSKSVYYLEALSYKALKKYKKALILLNKCIGMSLDESADGYFTAKGDILNLMHQPSNALKQYDTAYYIFQKPMQIYNKAKIYDGQFQNYKIALRYYKNYLNQTKDTTGSLNDKKVRAYVKKRVNQLETWRKETGK